MHPHPEDPDKGNDLSAIQERPRYKVFLYNLRAYIRPLGIAGNLRVFGKRLAYLLNLEEWGEQIREVSGLVALLTCSLLVAWVIDTLYFEEPLHTILKYIKITSLGALFLIFLLTAMAGRIKKLINIIRGGGGANGILVT
jgi:hypothetical protein